jgi:hypothetical protein
MGKRRWAGAQGREMQRTLLLYLKCFQQSGDIGGFFGNACERLSSIRFKFVMAKARRVYTLTVRI